MPTALPHVSDVNIVWHGDMFQFVFERYTLAPRTVTAPMSLEYDWKKIKKTQNSNNMQKLYAAEDGGFYLYAQ